MLRGKRRQVMLMLAAIVAAPTLAQQQTGGLPANTSHVIVPQARSYALHPHRPSPHAHGRVEIETITAVVNIVEQTASTTLDIRLVNRGSQRAEAILLLPVPRDAAVSAFMFDGASAEPTAQLLRADEARRLYDAIVAKVRDPALLEFAGYNLIRSSVFPIEPNATQRVRLTYESILSGDGDRIDYILPRSESLEARAPWDISVTVRAKSPISMIYSPSHDLVEERRDAKTVSVRVADSSRSDPGPFRLSYLLERDGMSASLFAYPDPKIGGGYFLLLAGLPATIDAQQHRLKREVTLVLDRSGSMAGGKLDQVRNAALQLIEGLDDGEAFNIVDYSNKAELFAKQPVLKDEATTARAREYLASLRPNGGTNIHDALLEALRQEPVEGMLPLVLFLTDGLPTVGQTSEVAIRDMVEAGNAHHRRVFTFGVGSDVNVPLLDRLAEMTRAKTTFVLPGEDVEVKVAQTFRALHGPMFWDVELLTRNSDGDESTTLVRELIPSTLPDVFEGDRIILLGQYRDEGPVTFELKGNYLGQPQTFQFTFDFDSATTRHAFVPRLWASRRIGFLIDEIRQAGAAAATQPSAVGESILNQPHYRELVDEIVRLSTEFGILSEYTSFLAREGTDLADWNALIVACTVELDSKAIRTRTGLGALNQGLNMVEQKGQSKLKYDNWYWNDKLEAVQITNVQQVADLAFIKRGTNWIDTRIVAGRKAIKPDLVIDFGSEAHRRLLRELIQQNRQGCLALSGDILYEHNGSIVLIRNTHGN